MRFGVSFNFHDELLFGPFHLLRIVKERYPDVDVSLGLAPFRNRMKLEYIPKIEQESLTFYLFSNHDRKPEVIAFESGFISLAVRVFFISITIDHFHNMLL